MPEETEAEEVTAEEEAAAGEELVAREEEEAVEEIRKKTYCCRICLRWHFWPSLVIEIKMTCFPPHSGESKTLFGNAPPAQALAQPQLAIHCHKSSPALVRSFMGSAWPLCLTGSEPGQTYVGSRNLKLSQSAAATGNCQLALPNGGAGFAASLRCIASVRWDSVLVRPTMRRIVNVYAVFSLPRIDMSGIIPSSCNR